MELDQLFDGKYRILEVLGKGGMGTVYLAENIKLGTLWAIKEINKSLSAHVDVLVEPNILKKLNHPALPRIFDIQEDEESVYILVDYIEGITLDKALEQAGFFDEAAVVPWLLQICDVLLYLHNHQPNPIIYRDLKPSNIILTGEGRIKLIDFGIARENKIGSDTDTAYIGTRGYAAPEQYGTGQTNPSSDLYSLGVTIYHLLTGIHPSGASFDFKPLRSLDRNITKEMEAMVMKCTRLNPAERYQSAQELLEDIRKLGPLTGMEKECGEKGFLIGRLPKDYKKVIGIVGSRASGSSTLAVALSEYFAENRKKVILVDLTQNRGLYEFFGWGYAKLYPRQGESCRRSLKDLSEGRMCPVRLERYRDLYISQTPVEIEPGSCIDMVDRLRSSGEIVIFDMDFNSPVEWVKHLNHLYIVKDMNLYQTRETSEYLYALKSAGLNLSKIRFVINKFLECNVKPKNIVDVATTYGLEDLCELLTEERPPFYTVPFEMENYKRSIESIHYPLFTCEGFSRGFHGAIRSLGDSILPVSFPITVGERMKRIFAKVSERY